MLTEDEIYNIKGGGISATLLNSISRLIEGILNLGQLVGSAIRRGSSKTYCKLS